jgi:hypothetical protein
LIKEFEMIGFRKIAVLLLALMTAGCSAENQPVNAEKQPVDAERRPVDEKEKASDTRVEGTSNVEKVKSDVDLRALTAGLKDKAPEVRRRNAVALHVALKNVDREEDLKEVIPTLLSASRNDSDAHVRQHTRFALRHALDKIKDETAFVPVAQSYLDGLKHKDPTVRYHCAHDLSHIVGKITDERALIRLMGPMTAATLRSGSMKAKDFPGFGLRTVLRKVRDSDAMISVMRSFIGGLDHEDSTMRTFCAHGLHENVSKIRDKTVLARMVKPLTTASLRAEDSKDKGMGAADLAYSALKQVLDRVDDQAALLSIIETMALALGEKEVKPRRYAAHAVMLFGHKVKNKKALEPLYEPLVAAYHHDTDERVRVSARFALHKTFGRVPEKP